MERWDDLLRPRSRTGLLTLAEAETRLRSVASELGAERVKLGQSRAGRPVELVRIGAGPRRSFWYGGPHANEPLGVSTIVELAERLAARPGLLAGDIGFDLLLCIDPDAYVLNERWFAPVINMADYYRGFYRQAMDECPDWDLPVAYRSTSGTLRRAPKLPETLALLSGLELSRPYVLNALHNAELGGVHFCVLGAGDGLAQRLSALPARFGMPREEAMLDDPGAEPLAPGVFGLPDLTPAYEAVLQSGHEDPASLLPLGESAAAWCAAQFGTVTVVAEIPYWSASGQRSNAGETLGDLARGTAWTLNEFAAWLDDFAVTHVAYLPMSDPHARSTLNAVGMMTRIAAGLGAWADSDAAKGPATSDAVARYELMLGLCLPQRYRSMLLSALTAAQAPPSVTVAAEAAFQHGLDALAAIPCTAYPVTELIDLQLTAGLIATDHVTSSAR
ncbi:hypothetical protein [Streptomyces phaeochromogenes]|uniref:hypothetical protein n=1 Tax=Streptomyces phaeochromogenes TaxID=1923 RepID=UPI0033D7324D